MTSTEGRKSTARTHLSNLKQSPSPVTKRGPELQMGRRFLQPPPCRRAATVTAGERSLPKECQAQSPVIRTKQHSGEAVLLRELRCISCEAPNDRSSFVIQRAERG